MADNRNFYKYSPGRQASRWDEDRHEGIMAINFGGLTAGDLNQYSSREELATALGLNHTRANKSWNLWLFKEAKIGDKKSLTRVGLRG